MNKYFIKAGSVSLSIFAILACETPQDNNIEEARQCSDSVAQMAATNPSMAASIASTTCEPLIQNIQTTEAGLIGVGLVLIEEQKLSNLSAMESAVSSSTNAIASSVSFLVFSAKAHVTNILNYAQESLDPGSEELASIISFAYFANTSFGGALNSSSTPTDVYNAVEALIGDATNGPPAAQAILSAQSSACAGGSTSSLCTDLTQAIGGATTTNGVLTNLATYIQNGG